VSLAAAPASPVPGTATTTVAALPNGFRVLVRENPVASVVAATLFVAVGSCHEPAAVNGVTALLGRVLLKGTRTRSALELAQLAEDAGGALESATDQEYSELRVRGLARHWRLLVGLLRDMATAPAFQADEIERERQTLLAMIRGLEDQPFQVANRLLSRALYGEHPAGQPAAGAPATVERLGRPELIAHFERAFTPERMILAVSGQVSAAEVLPEVERVFGTLVRRGGEPATEPPPGRPVTPRVVERRPTEQDHVLVGFMAPSIGHPDHVPLKVLNAALGGGMSGRLFRTLRDEEGLAYSVGSFYPTRRGSSRLVVHIGTAPDNLTRAEAGIGREIRGLQEGGVPDEELARAKAYLTGAFDLDLRTNARQSFYLGFFELMGAGHAYVGRYPAAIEAVTSEAVRRVAGRWLVEPATVVVGPA
jgi:predicted Zn-dependent peptidase